MAKSVKRKTDAAADGTSVSARNVPLDVGKRRDDATITGPEPGVTPSYPRSSADAGKYEEPARKPRPRATREWAAFIFMKPDRSLEAAALKDVEEMKAVGALTGAYVAVQVERFNDVERMEIDDGVERPHRSPNPRPRTIAAAVRSFAAWVMEPFPAKHRLAVMWGHASGVGFDLAIPQDEPGVDPFAPWAPVRRPVGARAPKVPPATLAATADARRADDATQLTIRGLVDCVKEMRPPAPPRNGALAAYVPKPRRKLDVLGLDSCYMSSAECGYELREYVDYLVASESFMQTEGWNYREVLGALSKGGPQTPKCVGEAIVRHAMTLPRSSSISMLKLSEMPALVSAFGLLVDALIRRVARPDEQRALKIVLSRVAFLKVRQFLDLRDMCHKLLQHFDGEVAEAATGVLKVLAGDLVFHRARGLALGRLNGVSIFYPYVRARVLRARCDEADEVNAVVEPEVYRELGFVKATNWADLLDRLFAI